MAFRGWGLKRIDFFLFFVADYQCRLFFLFFFWVVEEHSCLLRGGDRVLKMRGMAPENQCPCFFKT